MSRPLKRLLICLPLAGAFCARRPALVRGAGYPDINFTGYQATPVDNPLGGRLAAGYAVAYDGGGDILIAGVLADKSGAYHLAVLRLENDGTLDPLFGARGVAYDPKDPPAWGAAMAMDGGGRILIAGSQGAGFGNSNAVVLRRLLREGNPDPLFARGGLARAAGPFGGRAAAYAVAPLGRGALVGGAASGPNGQTWGAVWRFDDDGELEQAFGRGGVALFPAPPGYSSQVRALLPQSGGSVLAAGTLDGRMAIWKLLPGGGLDRSFGRRGVALGPWGQARALAAGAGGVLWLGGFVALYNRVTGAAQKRLPAVAAFSAAGALDKSFGRGGTEFLAVPNFSNGAQIFALAENPQGGLYAAGDAGAAGKQACFWALDAGGLPISDFGAGGVMALPNAAGGVDDRAYSIAFDGAGRILAAGISRDKTGAVRLALWRVLPAR